ncbi:MAG: hypothetical protein IJR70_00580 [Eubacterium sp.]|nr:hypothetical protein [Eubacterium sp.]
MDELWHNFLVSGKAEDYIKYVNSYYKSIEQNQVTQNAVNNERLDNQGTEYRGE